ncbi:MAG TPA: pyruvate kinase [Rectinemataceae bacterium]
MIKRTKIVATLGPASSDAETVHALIEEGVDVFRINFSHTGHDTAERAARLVRKASADLDKPVALMADIKGPAVRLYGYSEPLHLEGGGELAIESRDLGITALETLASPDPSLVYTNLPGIDRLCSPGQKVILMDGYFTGRVVGTSTDMVRVKIDNSGRLRPKAHLTLPGVDYPIPFLSDKDIADMHWAVAHEIDYLALSFVRSAADIEEARRIVQRASALAPASTAGAISSSASGRKAFVRLIAKIESAQGLANVDEIIGAADGIMVARGDMGVEMPLETVPIAQKTIIRKGYLSAKPVITATQMLESMIENPMPTRAEASDVANACFDSTSAVMLSGETAIGKHPAQVVRTMRSIIGAVEENFPYEEFHRNIPSDVKSGDIPAIMSYSAVSAAYLCGAKALIVLTETGQAARLLSRLRPRMPILAFMSDARLRSQLALNWGVVPLLHSGRGTRLDQVVDEVIGICKERGLLAAGDRAVIVAGLPLSQQGTTNMIRVETVA